MSWMISIITAISTTFIGIILYSDVVKESAIFFLIVIFLLNFLYLLIWCYYLVTLGGLDKILAIIRQKIQDFKEKFKNYSKD